MGVLVLRPEDHFGLLRFSEGVDMMRAGFEDFARSPVILSNPRTRTITPEGFRMTVHQGVSPSRRGACTSGRGERVQILPQGQQKYPGRGRPVFSLFDTETANLLMVMIGEPRAKGYEEYFATAGYHTACAAVVGTNMMARPDATRVGLLGSGGQAIMHLAALAETRSISQAVVYSPTPANREKFARDMQVKLGFPIQSVQSSDEVLETAEILLVCTNSNQPVLDGRKLRPGTHITSIVHSNKELLHAGVVKKMRQEIDDETLRRSGPGRTRPARSSFWRHAARRDCAGPDQGGQGSDQRKSIPERSSRKARNYLFQERSRLGNRGRRTVPRIL